MILAYRAESNHSSITLKCSDGREITTGDYNLMVAFLLIPCDMAVVYNIDKFVDVLTTIIPSEVTEQLHTKHRCYLGTAAKLYYQSARMFGITCVNEVNFYGLSRYTDTEIVDVNELHVLGIQVLKAYESLGIKAKKLTSPVGVFSSVLENMDFPRACDLPDTAFDILDQCTKVMTREWRQVYRLGHWEADEIADYDLNAGYPSIIARLPDLSAAQFFQSDTMPLAYTWGLLQGTLQIEKPVSPFQKDDDYPVGSWPDLITTDQLWLLDKYSIGSFKMGHGWFFTIPAPTRYPFNNLMARLYHNRNNGNDLTTKIAKGISVGVWGRFAQRFDSGKLGDDFNSIYALMTTSRCMVKVAAFIYHNRLEHDLVSVIVDGCLATRILPFKNTGDMGSWRINEPSPALVLSTLYQWLSDKRPNSMTYDEMMELIKKNPHRSCYGDVDFNLLDYNRDFPKLPKSGGELLSHKYESQPYRREL